MAAAEHGADRDFRGPGGQGSTYVENLAWSLLPPHLVAAALFLLGGGAHLAWGAPDRVGLISGALGVGSALLTALTVWVSRARHPVIRTLAVASVALAGVWLIMATSWGWGHGMWWIYPLPAGGLAIAWNIKFLLRGSGGEPAAEVAASPWGDVADNVRILKARVIENRLDGNRVKVRAQLEPGTTQSQVKQESEIVAGLLRTPPGGVTISGSPDDALEVEMSVMPTDTLKHLPPWPGPSHPGTSIADYPIHLGYYQDGDPVEISLPGRRGVKVVSHIRIQGISGAGKSELLQELADEVLSRTDTELEYVDCGDKAEQTVEPLRGGATRISITAGDAKKHLSDLKREIKPRAAHLAKRGLREWEKGCGLSFKVVVLDECGDSIAADKKAFTHLARKTRSVGILLVVAGQNLSTRQLPVDARKNFGTGICLGIDEAGDAGWVLKDKTIEAGAMPWEWGNTRPGYFYLEDGGVDERRWPIPARAHLTDPEAVRASVEANAAIRWKGAPLELAPEEADVDDEDGFPLLDDGGEDLDDFDPAAEAEQVRAAAYEVPESMREELEAIDALDPDAPLPTAGVPMDMDLGSGVRPSTEAASRVIEKMLDDMVTAGTTQFRRVDLVSDGALTMTQRSKSWLTGELKKHVQSGRLEVVGEPPEGVYRHVAPVHA